MLHYFDKSFRHEEICSKDTPVVVSEKRYRSRSVGCIVTAANITAGDAMVVTDMNNDDDDIVTTVFAGQYSAR